MFPERCLEIMPNVYMPCGSPIVGCELSPSILLPHWNGSITSKSDEILKSASINGFFIRCRWDRIVSDKRIVVKGSKPGTTLCSGFQRKIPESKIYQSFPTSFKHLWKHHPTMHHQPMALENDTEDDELHGSSSNTSWCGEIFYGVGWTKTYIPTAQDVGHVLRFECAMVDSGTGMDVLPGRSVVTSPVMPDPSSTPNPSIWVNYEDDTPFHMENRTAVYPKFAMLSYNVLADLYVRSDMYTHCPSWALTWEYRKENLLGEILGYKADILCLQEVQRDHFEEFFAPQLEKHGYDAIYKRKTAEVFTGTVYTTDGCATFFRRDRFSLVKKYELEFNKVAYSFTKGVVPTTNEADLTRLLKDNVALITILETCHNIPGAKNRQLCVVNTHIHADPNLKDVKLWQVHTLLKEVENIFASQHIPMLITGDFNSVPGSAPHALLTSGRVNENHPDLEIDPLGILRPFSKLCHDLPLVSVYPSSRRMSGVEEELQRAHSGSNDYESHTQYTIDYIFYTEGSLEVLEMLDPENLRKQMPLPSPGMSSDHLALLAQFRYQ